MQFNESGLRAWPNDYANTTSLAAFRRVVLDSSGNLAYASATQAGLGTLDELTATSDQFGTVRLWNKPGTRFMIASGAISANARCFASASGKVASTGSIPIGTNVGAAATADGDLIEVLPFTAIGTEMYSQVAAGTALTASSTETAIGSYTFAANQLAVGDVIRISFQGIATATNSTDTLTVKLYIGGLAGTALLTGTATDVANSNIFAGVCELVVRTVGASGTFVAFGYHTDVPAASGTATIGITEITASTTIDTTATQQVAVGAAWSTTNAGNSCRLDILNVQHLPRMAA